MRALVACSAALLALALPSTTRAAAECAPFPNVALWGEYTHETVRRHVNDNLAGEWSSYANQLQRQLTTLRDVYSRGSGVAVKRDERTVRLTGEELAAYIRLADQRMTIVRCLADAAATLKFASFSTAAGTSAIPPSDSAGMTQEPVKAVMQSTYISLPEHMLEKLRKMAVRRSVKEGRQASVGEIVAEILEREFRR